MIRPPKTLLPLIIIIILPCSFLSAQKKADSAKIRKDSTFVQYFTSNFEKYGILRFNTTDTAITGVENYNPLYKHSRFYATLGNIGQAHLNLVPFSSTPASGFTYGINSFDRYLYKNDSVRYYRVYKTYTDLEYVQGANKELFFHAIFSRNLYRSLNIGFDFRVLSSNGAYVSQKTNHINFVLTSQFFSRNRRYGAIANFRLNVLRNQENGGIKTDSIFEQNLETNREIIPVNLSLAQNRVRENGFFIKNYFNLSRHHQITKDTVGNTRKGVELGRVALSFEFNRQTQNYLDDNLRTGFYQNFYLDTIKTRDSIGIDRFTTIFSWTNPNFKPDRRNRLLQIEASIKHDYIEVYNYHKRKYFNQFIPFGEISFTPYYGFQLRGYADYVIGDFNGGDMSIRASLSQILGGEKRNAGYINISAFYALQKPGWFYEHFRGNNFTWDTAWRQQGIISGGFSYGFRQLLEAGVNITRVNRFVYLNTSALPEQLTSEFGYMQVYLKGKIKPRQLTITTHLVYQTVQGTTVLKIPVFIGTLSTYYSIRLFQGAAILQPGLTFNYNSLYYGNAYMPAIRSFYLQDEKQIGDYVYMDVFANIKIQRARIFFQYSHFNASLMNHKYYTVPHYPMQDAAFRFGLTWRFHD